MIFIFKVCLKPLIQFEWNLIGLISSSSPCAYILFFGLNDFLTELWPLKTNAFFVVSSKSIMFSFIIWVIHTFSTLQKSLRHLWLQSSYTSLSVCLSEIARLHLKSKRCDFFQTLQEWLVSSIVVHNINILQFTDFCQNYGPLMIFMVEWLLA